jgi:hypothetical protein
MPLDAPVRMPRRPWMGRRAMRDNIAALMKEDRRFPGKAFWAFAEYQVARRRHYD